MLVKEYRLVIDKDYKNILKESGAAYKVDGRKVFNNPLALADFFGDAVGIRNAANEHVYVACLDSKLHIIGCFEASHGTVNASLFPVREILQKALLIGAVSIAIAHNHPAGDITPSAEDTEATERIKAACDIIGIQLIDHIIIGANTANYYSFAE